MKKLFAAMFFAFLAIAQWSVANAMQQSQLFYEAYVESEGWLSTVAEGEVAGTVGEGIRNPQGAGFHVVGNVSQRCFS